MSLLSTIDLFIEELEADLVDISWQIREETNYSDCNLDYLSDLYDDKEQHHQNLKEIKKLLIQHNLIGGQ